MADESQSAGSERQQVERLLRELEEESRKHKPVLQSAALLPIGCGTVILAVGPCSAAFEYSAWPGFLFLIGEVVWLLSLKRLGASKRQQSIAHALTRIDDKRVIGPLLTAMRWPDLLDSRETLELTLIHLLPRLNAGDSSLLTAPQHSSLMRALHKGSPELSVAVLQALEQIGGPSDLPHVRRLIERRAWTHRQKIVKRAAIDCLPALQARLDQSGHGLLRVPDVSDDTLLRPSGEVRSLSSDTLLRAAPTEAEEETDK